MIDRNSLASEHLGGVQVPEGLGMDAVAKRIAGFIESSRKAAADSPHRAPIVGVFGRWGSGKTHLLNQLGQALTAKYDRYLVCCYRAWEYETEGDLAAALIRALIDEDNYPWNKVAVRGPRFLPDKETLKQAAGDLVKAIISLVPAAVPGVGGVSAAALTALIKAMNREYQLPEEPDVRKVRTLMQEFMRRVVPDAGHHLVVLVDDLDRCAPPNMVRLFEWFKNHLDTERCTYVLGLDHCMAARAIVGHYRDYVGPSVASDTDYGYRYLDKLLDMDFEIQPSRYAERLALDRIGMSEGTTAEWTRRYIGKDYVGDAEMQRLLGVPALWVPRVMIRSLNTYKQALVALKDRNKVERDLFSNELPPSFPLWLLVISVLHHTFAPDAVQAFVEDSGSKTVPVDLEPTDPRLGIKNYLAQLSVTRPDRRALEYLFRVVKSKTPIPFRVE